MGRDIHLYAEYDPEGNPPFSDIRWIKEVAKGCFAMPRNYLLFQLLAGLGGSSFLNTVSGLSKDGQTKQIRSIIKDANEQLKNYKTYPHFEPRGLPELTSETITHEFYMHVCDLEDEIKLFGSLNSVSREEAESWVQSGISSYSDDSSSKSKGIANPDWHTPSYLNLAEINQIVAYYKQINEAMPIEFEGLVALLEHLELKYGTGRTRIIFWFDN